MFKIIVRILITLLVAAVLSGGLYTLVQNGTLSSNNLLQGGHSRPEIGNGNHRPDRPKGQPNQEGFNPSSNARPNGFEQYGRGEGGQEGSLVRGLGGIAGNLFLIALVTLIISGLRKLIGLIRPARQANATEGG